MTSQSASKSNVLDFVPIAPHLRSSEVLRMLHEEGETSIPMSHKVFSQYPSKEPTGHQFLAKGVASGGRPVHWPPAAGDYYVAAEEEGTVSYSYPRQPQPPSDNQIPPPVPPRPANYPQASMDSTMVSSSHQQQQTMSSTTTEVRTMKESYEQVEHQSYQYSYSSSHPSIQQQQQLQSVEQQSSFSSSSPASQMEGTLPPQPPHREYQVPIQLVPQGGTPPVQATPTGAPHEKPSEKLVKVEVLPEGGQSFQNNPTPPEAHLAQGHQQFPVASDPHPTQASRLLNASGNAPVWPPQNDVGQQKEPPHHPGFKLRSEIPLQQHDAPVYASQPAFKITQPVKMRGDQKWPPKQSHEVTQDEVREFIRPRKENKDYSSFFAQNALPPTFSSYRPPPGTQHHGVNGGESDM